MTSGAIGASLRAFVDAAFDAVPGVGHITTEGRHHIWDVGGTTWSFSTRSPHFSRLIRRGFGPGMRPATQPPRPDSFRVFCLDSHRDGMRVCPPSFNDARQLSPRSPQGLERVQPDPVRRVWLGRGIRVGHQLRENILTIVDLDRRQALTQVPDAATVPSPEQAAPMRNLIHWLMASRGRSLIHGAVIGTARGGVLLAGRGGSGKSSTALAGLAAGMHFAGDDYVLIDASDAPRAFGVYATAKVERTDVPLYSRLEAEFHHTTGPAGEKAVLFLNGDPPGFQAGLRLRAIVLPRISASPMRVQPCRALCVVSGWGGGRRRW